MLLEIVMKASHPHKSRELVRAVSVPVAGCAAAALAWRNKGIAGMSLGRIGLQRAKKVKMASSSHFAKAS